MTAYLEKVPKATEKRRLKLFWSENKPREVEAKWKAHRVNTIVKRNW